MATMKTIKSLPGKEASERRDDRISTLDSLYQDILDDLGGAPEVSLKKGDDVFYALITALYLCILVILKDKLVPGDFKYPTEVEFMQAYDNKFAKESDKEKNLLWQSANWMSILFKIVKASANQGLALAVIPKLLEGLNSKDLNLEMINQISHHCIHVT